jgi:magnesium chelatase family protein
MLATTNSACLHGVTAHLVHVEANSGETGDPRVVLVGLPDAAVKEAIDRVRSSLVNSGYSLPRTRVTINLAPSDLRKEGASYDLPIAISLLGAITKDVHHSMSQYLIAGELSLSGEVRPIKGAIAMALLARQLGFKGIILPHASAQTASVVEGVSVIGVQSLSETFDFITGKKSLDPLQGRDGILNFHSFSKNIPDFTDIKGQGNVRRAVEIAVAGGHNFLMSCTKYHN